MKRLTSVFLGLLFWTGMASASTSIFQTVAADSGVKKLEAAHKAEGFSLYALKISDLQYKCPNCLNIDVVFRGERNQWAKYMAATVCRPGEVCQIKITEK